jgi:hypothetical protein
MLGAASWAQSNMGTGQWLHDFLINYQKVITVTKNWPAISDASK